jgi:NADPH2 dehydrogenase
MIRLDTALTQGKLRLKNRLVMPPMATAKAGEDGCVTDDILRYYDEKSDKGQIGLVIVEHSYVSLRGKASERQMSAAQDRAIPGLERLAELLRANGTKSALQLNHAGSAAISRQIGPSQVAHPTLQTIPLAMTCDQIAQAVEDFARAAGRVRQAGFDAVEIHAAHGFLLNQFYSPLTNRRDDAYGGSLENRLRIHLEILRAVRLEVGPDYPILMRLGGSDYMQGGATVADGVAAAQMLEAAGVDLLDISGGFCRYINPPTTAPGFFSELSTSIRSAVSIPVLLTGGITTAEQANDLLARGAADLIGVGRAILKDSLWAARAMGLSE